MVHTLWQWRPEESLQERQPRTTLIMETGPCLGLLGSPTPTRPERSGRVQQRGGRGGCGSCALHQQQPLLEPRKRKTDSSPLSRNGVLWCGRCILPVLGCAALVHPCALRRPLCLCSDCACARVQAARWMHAWHVQRTAPRLPPLSETSAARRANSLLMQASMWCRHDLCR